jgi:hypothetical protein
MPAPPAIPFSITPDDLGKSVGKNNLLGAHLRRRFYESEYPFA